MQPGLREVTWTRTLEPFGITVHCREVRLNKVLALQFSTGTYVHAVERAILEWVVGAPKMHIRYILECGTMQRQERIIPYTNRAVKINCHKCREALRKKKKP